MSPLNQPNNTKWETLVAYMKLAGIGKWVTIAAGSPRECQRCYVIEKSTQLKHRGMSVYKSGYIAGHNYHRVYDAVHNPHSKYRID